MELRLFCIKPSINAPSELNGFGNDFQSAYSRYFKLVTSPLRIRQLDLEFRDFPLQIRSHVFHTVQFHLQMESLILCVIQLRLIFFDFCFWRETVSNVLQTRKYCLQMKLTFQ